MVFFARVAIDFNRHIERVIKSRGHLFHEVPFWFYILDSSTL